MDKEENQRSSKYSCRIGTTKHDASTKARSSSSAVAEAAWGSLSLSLSLPIAFTAIILVSFQQLMICSDNL